MSQRDTILPVTRVFTLASGTTSAVALYDTTGGAVHVTYATLIDLSGNGTNGDWYRMAPGSVADPDWAYTGSTSGVGFHDNGAGTGTYSDASSINNVAAAPGVVGPFGTTLVLSTAVAFNKVTIGNHSDGITYFALTYGNIKHANTTKDQQQTLGADSNGI